MLENHPICSSAYVVLPFEYAFACNHGLSGVSGVARWGGNKGQKIITYTFSNHLFFVSVT